MGAVLALAERFWRGEVRGPDLVRATGAVEEIAPGVLFVHAFANVTALRTDAGLVLVDTGNYRARDKTFAAVRGWDARALVAGVYTHGHVDHARAAGRARASWATATSRAASIAIARPRPGTA